MKNFKKTKNFLKEKFAFAILFFTLGIASVLVSQKIKEGFKKTSFPEATITLADPIEIKEREDEHYVYYEILLKQINRDKLDVRVENGQVAISGELTKRSDSDDQQVFFRSQFRRILPTPIQTDADGAQIENQEDRIIIKFLKV